MPLVEFKDIPKTIFCLYQNTNFLIPGFQHSLPLSMAMAASTCGT